MNDIDKNSSSGYYRSDREGNSRNNLAFNSNYIKPLNSPAIKDISSLGRYYSNQIQSDELFIPSSLLVTKNYILFTLGEGDLLNEDSYFDYKNYSSIFSLNNFSLKPLISNNSHHYSSFNVLNNFRSNCEDFN